MFGHQESEKLYNDKIVKSSGNQQIENDMKIVKTYA